VGELKREVVLPTPTRFPVESGGSRRLKSEENHRKQAYFQNNAGRASSQWWREEGKGKGREEVTHDALSHKGDFSLGQNKTQFKGGGKKN